MTPWDVAADGADGIDYEKLVRDFGMCYGLVERVC